MQRRGRPWERPRSASGSWDVRSQSGSISRVLSRATISLRRRLLAALCDLPGSRRIGPIRSGQKAAFLPIWSCSGWGLPSQAGHPTCWCALTAPFHPCLLETRSPDRRSVLCGTFPVLTDGGCYPPPCPVEPGLSSVRSCAEQRPPDPLCVSRSGILTQSGEPKNGFSNSARVAIVSFPAFVSSVPQGSMRYTRPSSLTTTGSSNVRYFAKRPPNFAASSKYSSLNCLTTFARPSSSGVTSASRHSPFTR